MNSNQYENALAEEMQLFAASLNERDRVGVMQV
jgi:hypothetical protein